MQRFEALLGTVVTLSACLRILFGQIQKTAVDMSCVLVCIRYSEAAQLAANIVV